MSEFYVIGNSFAAPFVSDQLSGWVTAQTAAEALEKFARDCKHPCGVYAAEVYEDANAHSKGQPALARWLSNHARMIESATKGKGSYGIMSLGPGKVEVDGVLYECQEPKAGSLDPLIWY